MAMNDPSQNYNRESIELRFELERERNDKRFERLMSDNALRQESMLNEIREEFRGIDRGFRLLDRDMNWLKVILGAIIVPLIVSMLPQLLHLSK